MRSVILVSIAVLIAAVSCGYCIVWYGQSLALKHAIEGSIANINAKEPYLTYDSIETSGFPSQLFVTIVKPHFKGRIDTLLQPSQNPAPLPKWEEDATLDGRIVFGVSMFSDVFTLAVTGSWQETSHIADDTVTMVSKQGGESRCTLNLERSNFLLGTLWNFQLLAQDDGKVFLQNFKNMDCSMAASTVSNPVTQEIYMSNGSGRFSVSHVKSEINREIRAYYKFSDMEVTPQGDVLFARYFRAFAPGYIYPVMFSAYGKQNMEMDLTLDGPLDLSKDTANPDVKIALTKFDVTNSLYNSKISFALNNATSKYNDKPLRSAYVTFRADSNFAEPYDKFMQSMVYASIQNIRNSKEPVTQPWQTRFNSYTPEQLYAIIYPSLFSLHGLGNIVQNLDVEYTGTPDFATGNISLKALELSSTPYGIKANGAGTIIDKKPQNAEFNLLCTHCLVMVDDMTGYTKRLQTTLSYFSPEYAANLAVPAGKVEAIKKLLSALAAKDPADQSNFHYNVKALGATPPSINGKPFGEVMALTQEYLGPYMQPPATQAPAH